MRGESLLLKEQECNFAKPMRCCHHATRPMFASLPNLDCAILIRDYHIRIGLVGQLDAELLASLVSIEEGSRVVRCCFFIFPCMLM